MRTIVCCCLCLAVVPAAAHDTWVETNTNLIRTGDSIFVELKLGNHGNEHRDFKLASKVDLEPCTLTVVDPAGAEYDLKPNLVDVGYAPKEGYWTTKFVPAKPGMYVVAHTRDSVVNHGKPERSIKSGKTCFVASNLLDKVPYANPGFDKPLGHPLELVPVSNPITPMGPGETIRVQVLFRGKPADEMRVSFIPQGETLSEGFDDRYEHTTDGDGLVSFEPKTGDRYLVVAHHHTDEAGTDYEATKYSATLTVYVPEICPCCE
jgi:uncharacterized GH25 family protein